jgi:hypothetical protein
MVQLTTRIQTQPDATIGVETIAREHLMWADRLSVRDVKRSGEPAIVRRMGDGGISHMFHTAGTVAELDAKAAAMADTWCARYRPARCGDWPTDVQREELNRAYRAGIERGGTSCCGTTGVDHLTFCPLGVTR